MNSKSEQRRLTVQLDGRLCCVCGVAVPVEGRRVWAASGMPPSFLCCVDHVAQARELLTQEVARRKQ